jgi:hypothetical protein
VYPLVSASSSLDHESHSLAGFIRQGRVRGNPRPSAPKSDVSSTMSDPSAADVAQAAPALRRRDHLRQLTCDKRGGGVAAADSSRACFGSTDDAGDDDQIDEKGYCSPAILFSPSIHLLFSLCGSSRL